MSGTVAQLLIPLTLSLTISHRARYTKTEASGRGVDRMKVKVSISTRHEKSASQRGDGTALSSIYPPISGVAFGDENVDSVLERKLSLFRTH